MMNDYVRNKRILDKFFDNYARPPSYEEFLKIGGKADCYYSEGHSYNEFLSKYGYRKVLGKNTYEIINDRGNVVFIGTKKDVIEEFDLHPTTSISAYIKRQGKLKFIYTVRKVEINLNPEFYLGDENV